MGKNLTLTGMMGVGKSTIGKILAKQLNYKFVDVDKLIESKEGSTINYIFKNKSESYFRKIENDITLVELKKYNSVISMGGGAFLNSSIRSSAKKLSTSFWLDVPIDIQSKNISIITEAEEVVENGENGENEIKDENNTDQNSDEEKSPEDRILSGSSKDDVSLRVNGLSNGDIETDSIKGRRTSSTLSRLV